MNSCACGCGFPLPTNRRWAAGHHPEYRKSFDRFVQPAGMTYARALEIAIEVADRAAK